LSPDEEWVVIDFGDMNTTIWRATKKEDSLIAINDNRDFRSIIAFTPEEGLFGNCAENTTYETCSLKFFKTKIGSNTLITIDVNDTKIMIQSRVALAYYIHYIVKTTNIKNVLFVHPIYWDDNQKNCVKDAFEIMKSVEADIKYEFIDSMSAIAIDFMIRQPEKKGCIGFIDSGCSHTTASIFQISENKITNKYTTVIDLGGEDLTHIVANYTFNTFKEKKLTIWTDEAERKTAEKIMEKIENGNDNSSKIYRRIFLDAARKAKQGFMGPKSKILFDASLSTDTDFKIELSYMEIAKYSPCERYLGELSRFFEKFKQYTKTPFITEFRGGNSVSAFVKGILDELKIPTTAVLNLRECFAEGAAKMMTQKLSNTDIIIEIVKAIGMNQSKLTRNKSMQVFKNKKEVIISYTTGNIQSDKSQFKNFVTKDFKNHNFGEIIHAINSSTTKEKTILTKLKEASYDPERFKKIFLILKQKHDMKQETFNNYDHFEGALNSFKKEITEEFKKQMEQKFKSCKNYNEMVMFVKNSQKAYNFLKLYWIGEEKYPYLSYGAKIIERNKSEKEKNYKSQKGKDEKTKKLY
jgi:hypothetical protein